MKSKLLIILLAFAAFSLPALEYDACDCVASKVYRRRGGDWELEEVKGGIATRVRPVVANDSEAYFRIPLATLADGVTPDGENYTYIPDEAGVGDLDGDGEYEIVLKRSPSIAKDNSQDGYTGESMLEAYRLDGRFLWRIALGVNIRSGAHYTQLLVYDLDGDGKAEVIIAAPDDSSILVYSSPHPTEYRFHTFMLDPVYRLSIATWPICYNQSP